MLRWTRILYSEYREIAARDNTATEEEMEAVRFIDDLRSHYKPASHSKGILLVPLMNDAPNMKMTMRLAFRIAEENGLLIRYFFVHTAIDIAVIKSRFYTTVQYLKNRYISGPKRLRKIYGIRKSEILFSNYFKPTYLAESVVQAATKEELLNINNDGIVTGDLIYDTYLRFKSKPTPDLTDSSLQDLITYTAEMVRRWKKLLYSKNISQLLIPYATYIHWGIPARAAVDKGVKVTTFGSYLYILSNMRKEHPFHSKDHHIYRSLFEKINNKPEKIAAARIKLESRLGGEIDTGTTYMKASAFGDTVNGSFFFESGKPAAVIFLHCFFDSPHIYGEGLFVDFYEWIYFLLEKAGENSAVNYYFKPHPNGLPANGPIIEELKEKFSVYPNIFFIEPSVSNKQIVTANPKAVFTFYGTVAHEFAYLGIPVVGAGDNPHISYNFIYNPASVQELAYFVMNVGQYRLPDGYIKDEIPEFFFMHYMYYSPILDEMQFNIVKNFYTGEIALPERVSMADMTYNRQLPG